MPTSVDEQPHSVVTLDEAAEILTEPVPTMLRLVEAGDIPVTATPHGWEIAVDELLAYKARRDTERGAALAELTRFSEEIERSWACPVCDGLLDFLPWSGDAPSYEICPSCGIQFGYDDEAGGDRARRAQIYQEWRKLWVEKGKEWLWRNWSAR